jgi:hypothetical protein
MNPQVRISSVVIRLGFGKRPLWRNYLAAYLLIGSGFMLGDIAITGRHGGVIEIVGAAIFFAGILVFAAALAHSIWFVISRKP